MAMAAGRVSVKGENWRIVDTLPMDGDALDLPRLVRDPKTVAVLAYVTNAAQHPA